MFYDEHVHIEEEDQCYTCAHFLKGVMCPLLEALAVGVAHLDEDVLVRNCGFYVEFKRNLQLVETSEPAAETTGMPGEAAGLNDGKVRRLRSP